MLSNRMLMASSSGIVTLPSGLILPFNDIAANIPSGWARFTGMDGKQVVGAGSTYAVAATGGDSSTDAVSRGSTTAGAHGGDTEPGPWSAANSGGVVLYSISTYQVSGGHSHGLTADYEREYQQLLLIKASEDHEEFPADAIALSKESTTPLSGLTICHDDNRVLRSGATIANGGGSLSSTACSSAGAHAHYEIYAQYSPGSITMYTYKSYAHSSLNHVHTISAFTLDDESLKRAYLTAWTKTSAFDGASGMIAMWEGATAPDGWRLCDGTGGTLDLRDYYIILSSSGNAGDSYDEDNKLQTSITLATNAWNHTHVSGTITDGGGNVSDKYHGDYSASHNHTFAQAWTSHTPLYYALTFIQAI